MNSTSLRNTVYVLLTSSVTALGVFSYLNQKKSRNIQKEVRNINVVVRQYSDQVDDTNNRLDKTNDKLSIIKRKISSLRKLVTSNPDYDPDRWANLKNQVDNTLGKVAELYEKFDNIESKIDGINSRIKTIKTVQNGTEQSTIQEKVPEDALGSLTETSKALQQIEEKESGDSLDSLLDNLDLN